MKLVGILNTKPNQVIPEEDAIMKIMPEGLTTFDEVIGYLLKGEDSSLADTVRQYLNETNQDKPFDIEVLDADGNNKRNFYNERSIIMRLNEDFNSYMDQRSLVVDSNEQDYMCLDMVVDLNTKVGQ